MIVYKFTKEDGTAPWGSGKWPLPKDGKPGDWAHAEGALELCKNGIHGFPSVLSILNEGLYDSALWVAEIEGTLPFNGNSKVVGRSGRLLYRVNAWNKVSQRLWAADCAERVLPIWCRWAEARLPAGDERIQAPNKAIELARNPGASGVLLAAAGAAGAAAWAAAWDAAGAAGGAARAAARAAWDAGAAGAAGAAARAAARAAAEAAWDARAAAGAAWDAGAAAEREWQAIRLHQYLTGSI